MIINRNGFIIELTVGELREAHDEYEYLSDIDDVHLVLEEDFESIDASSVSEDTKEKMAKRKRKHQDNGMLWREATRLAVRDILEAEALNC